jgi:hypothetical protein
VITFNGINMFTTYGGTAGTQAGENAVLQGLINNNKLFVD